jgi:hypothetical protein
MSEGGVGTVIRHTLGNFTLLRGDGGLLESATILEARAAAMISSCVDVLPAAAWRPTAAGPSYRERGGFEVPVREPALFPDPRVNV